MPPTLEKFTDPLPAGWRVDRLLVDFKPDGICLGMVTVILEVEVPGTDPPERHTVATQTFPLEKLDGEGVPNVVRDVIPAVISASQASAHKAGVASADARRAEEQAKQGRDAAQAENKKVRAANVKLGEEVLRLEKILAEKEAALQAQPD